MNCIAESYTQNKNQFSSKSSKQIMFKLYRCICRKLSALRKENGGST